MRPFVLLALVVYLTGSIAHADNFTFSFTDQGDGTVTGEIFGLQNNGMAQAATEVLITSYPASFGSIQDLIATDWDQQAINVFTETNGVITAAAFQAGDSLDPLFPAFLITINGTSAAASLGFIRQTPVSGILTLSPAPVPEPFSWFLLLTVMLAVAIVKRRRRTDGLDDPATRTRS